MKVNNLLLSLVLLLFGFAATAQQGINYKAIIHDANGDPVIKTTVTVHFTILENGSSVVYKESHMSDSDVNGIIVANIGEGTPITGNFKSIDWGSNPHFLKTEIDIGDGLKDMGTTEFQAVPYALYAKDSPRTTELSELSDAKHVNTSLYLTGYQTGWWDDGSTLGGNVFIGIGAGANNRGSGNILIGYYSGHNLVGDNQLCINNSGGKPLIHGDFNTEVVTINGELRGEDSGDADMKAYIYGSIKYDGTINTASSTDGFTVGYEVGWFYITFTGANKPNGTQYIVLVTEELESTGSYRSDNFADIKVIKRDGGFFVKCLDKSVDESGLSLQTGFAFVVYKI